VQLCLGDVEVCQHDNGSQDEMYDLQLRWPEGRIESMEVTRATSETMRQVVKRLDREGPVIATEATRNWYVNLSPDSWAADRAGSAATWAL
jgi:hypothetical protein